MSAQAQDLSSTSSHARMTGPFTSAPKEPRDLYLDLMKRALTNWIYADTEPRAPQKVGVAHLADRVFNKVDYWLGNPFRLPKPTSQGAQSRLEGDDWPPTAHTMIGLKRLDNIQYCVEQIVRNSVPGDLIETGVWRGGASIFMRACLKAHGIENRRVILADSFQGLPPPSAEQDHGSKLHEYSELAISLDQVKANFQKYGLLDSNVEFLVGWFEETLPKLAVRQLAIARLDGDMYSSTMVALESLYPKLSKGGFLIVDDYGALETCRRAVHDYRDKNGITDSIQTIDKSGVFWKKS